MKATFFLVGLASVAIATPTPDLDARLAAADAAVGSLRWDGEIFPGKNYTLFGDAVSILDQIKAINPDYVPDAGVEARDLDKRAKNGGNCGSFSTANSMDTWRNTDYLSGLGGSCSVAARSCVRMACRQTSGVYLCNDNPRPISPNCRYLSGYALDIMQSCGSRAVRGHDFALSGQHFDTDRYNVVVAFADCRQTPSRRPNTYTPPGPNGNPWRRCNNCVAPR